MKKKRGAHARATLRKNFFSARRTHREPIPRIPGIQQGMVCRVSVERTPQWFIHAIATHAGRERQLVFFRNSLISPSVREERQNPIIKKARESAQGNLGRVGKQRVDLRKQRHREENGNRCGNQQPSFSEDE